MSLNMRRPKFLCYFPKTYLIVLVYRMINIFIIWKEKSQYTFYASVIYFMQVILLLILHNR